MTTNVLNGREYQVCSNCVMDTTDSLIKFDEEGICDHCQNYYEAIKPNWNNSESDKNELDRVISIVRKNGEGHKYDCIIGLSGGVDSTYLAYCAVKKWGLRPLLLVVDTGWRGDSCWQEDNDSCQKTSFRMPS